jgi:hypothetical protein
LWGQRANHFALAEMTRRLNDMDEHMRRSVNRTRRRRSAGGRSRHDGPLSGAGGLLMPQL